MFKFILTAAALAGISAWAIPEDYRPQSPKMPTIERLPRESTPQVKARDEQGSAPQYRMQRPNPGAVSEEAENAARRERTRGSRTTPGASSTSNSLPGYPGAKRNTPTTTTDQTGMAPGATGESNREGLGTEATQPLTMAYRVADMDCAGCERRVRNAVRKVPGVKNVRADADSGQVIFEIEDRDRVDETAVIRAIEREGFRVIR